MYTYTAICAVHFYFLSCHFMLMISHIQGIFKDVQFLTIFGSWFCIHDSQVWVRNATGILITIAFPGLELAFLCNFTQIRK
jgi:hypothetical protein